MEGRNNKALKALSVGIAALVYVLAIGYGDVMFITVMQDAFPTGILGGLAIAGAIATAISAIILPLALHFWFSPGLQFIAGIIFWLVDVAVLALNSMLAYAVATGSGMLATWGEFAPATPLLAVLGWGIMFLLDPSHKLRHAQMELESDLIDIHAEQLRQAAKDAGVAGMITSGAKVRASDFAALLTGVRTPLGRNAGNASKEPKDLPASLPSIASNNGRVYESDTELPAQLPASEPEILANPTPRRRSKS